MSQALVGIIGGSGLYQMDELKHAQEHQLDTPFGKPSDVVVTGEVDGVVVAFLARHGRGHRLIPSEVPYRANIYALKQLGVDDEGGAVTVGLGPYSTPYEVDHLVRTVGSLA